MGGSELAANPVDSKFLMVGQIVSECIFLVNCLSDIHILYEATQMTESKKPQHSCFTHLKAVTTHTYFIESCVGLKEHNGFIENGDLHEATQESVEF